MRKQLATLLTVVFLVSLGITANAAVKPGTICKKLGLTSLSSGKKYTCVKSGKKLVWDKGIVVVKPTPTPSTTSSPTQTFKFTPWSTVLDQETLLSQAKSQFEKWALKDHGNSITPTFIVDPKLDGIDISWIKNSLDLAVKAFGTDSPLTYSVIVGSDCQWIRAAGFAPCTDSSNNQYYSDSTSKGFFVLQSVSEMNKLRPSDLQTSAHEYFHAIQAKLSKRSDWPAIVPSWFIEGGANFIGISFSDLSGTSNYLDGRNEAILMRDYQIKKYLPLEQYTYLNFKPLTNYEDPYGIGCVATEYIVASVGMERYLNIYRSIGFGKDFKSSFETAVGISLSDFYTKFEIIRDKVGMPHGT